MTRSGRSGARLAAGLLLALLTTETYAQSFTPVTDEMLQDPDPADWPMWRHTLDGWGYSPLDEIGRSNVASLRMLWTRPMASDSDNQGTPLVYDGVMYIANPNDLIEALDPRTCAEPHRRVAIALVRSTRGSTTVLTVVSLIVPVISTVAVRRQLSKHRRELGWVRKPWLSERRRNESSPSR